MPGLIKGIYVSAKAEQLPQSRQRVLAHAGCGLVGDRYFAGVGTYSDHPEARGRHLTLLEAPPRR
jgi:hypothetical protein